MNNTIDMLVHHSLLVYLQSGTVRFGGAIDFLGGQWAGIELDDAVGKNDGSLKGIRFFTCKPKFGEFVTRVFMEWGEKVTLISGTYTYFGARKQGGKL